MCLAATAEALLTQIILLHIHITRVCLKMFLEIIMILYMTYTIKKKKKNRPGSKCEYFYILSFYLYIYFLLNIIFFFTPQILYLFSNLRFHFISSMYRIVGYASRCVSHRPQLWRCTSLIYIYIYIVEMAVASCLIDLIRQCQCCGWCYCGHFKYVKNSRYPIIWIV